MAKKVSAKENTKTETAETADAPVTAYVPSKKTSGEQKPGPKVPPFLVRRLARMNKN
ncbi:MAG: hypothetical protein WC959_10755 [Kiritimatiellales bacterium]